MNEELTDLNRQIEDLEHIQDQFYKDYENPPDEEIRRYARKCILEIDEQIFKIQEQVEKIQAVIYRITDEKAQILQAVNLHQSSPGTATPTKRRGKL